MKQPSSLQGFKCCASAKHHAVANLAGTGYSARSIWEVQLIDEIMVLDLEIFSAYGFLYSDGLAMCACHGKAPEGMGPKLSIQVVAF